jgi:hypothetical protein
LLPEWRSADYTKMTRLCFFQYCIDSNGYAPMISTPVSWHHSFMAPMVLVLSPVYLPVNRVKLPMMLSIEPSKIFFAPPSAPMFGPRVNLVLAAFFLGIQRMMTTDLETFYEIVPYADPAAVEHVARMWPLAPYVKLPREDYIPIPTVPCVELSSVDAYINDR